MEMFIVQLIFLNSEGKTIEKPKKTGVLKKILIQNGMKL